MLLLLYEALASQLAWAMQGSRFQSNTGLCLGIPEVLWEWRIEEGSYCEGRDPGALWEFGKTGAVTALRGVSEVTEGRAHFGAVFLHSVCMGEKGLTLMVPVPPIMEGSSW